jgi:hypothetical protein
LIFTVCACDARKLPASKAVPSDAIAERLVNISRPFFPVTISAWVCKDRAMQWRRRSQETGGFPAQVMNATFKN